MVERPYKYVSTISILFLIKEYKKLIDVGDFKKNGELQKLKEELDFRFNTETRNADDKQISIEEYMRERKKNERE